jgi:hypothetical protein
MHSDANMSDAYQARGPEGFDPVVSSRTQGFGGYGTIAFDRTGRLVAVHSSGRKFQLELMDPETLEELSSFDLPSRPWYFLFQGIPPWKYIGAGMYFYLDEGDRAIVPTTLNKIYVVRVPAGGNGGEFDLLREYDLNDYVVPLRWPKEDSVAWVLPDWAGKYYWYATTEGMVGTIEIASGQVQTLRLEGEIIENSFAVGEEGVFILSDRAMYRFGQDGAGEIRIDWRRPYDRGPGVKPGHITRGSGTSVTLTGGPEGIVAVTDNAEPRINVLFLHRANGERVCSVPVFEDGMSGTDISLVGFEHAKLEGEGSGKYSIIIENNWGHHRFPFAFPEPGIARIDLIEGPDGNITCGQVWSSEEKNIGVFKLSFDSGLLYTYFRGDSAFFPQWYLTAVDFHTGETVYKQLIGTGIGYNNWAGALFIHPDGGRLYSTTIFGLVMVHDVLD